MATKAEIIKLMTALALAWPRYELKDETFDVYFEILKDVPVEALTEAAKQIMAEATFFPAISEWRKAAFDILTRRMHIPNQFEAWEEVIEKAALVGHYQVPEFSHPLIVRAVKCCGWTNICLSEEPEFERNHFYRVYDTFLKRAQEEIRMLPDVKRAIEGPETIEWSTVLRLPARGGDHGSDK